MALNKERKQQIIQEFGMHTQDTGSVELQVALLTDQIKELTEHCKINKKDFSSRRGLLKMVCQRRNFLGYIARRDDAKYKELVQKLGLRK
jgi:small subunit ribosomal protein S15